MIRFVWTCSYINESFFDVLDGSGERFEVVYRWSVCDYERSICNGGAAAYARRCEPVVGFLRRSYHPLPLDIVRAFNDWRCAEHKRFIAKMHAEPERYCCVTPKMREVKGLAVGAAQWIGGHDGAWRLDRLEQAQPLPPQSICAADPHLTAA